MPQIAYDPLTYQDMGMGSREARATAMAKRDTDARTLRRRFSSTPGMRISRSVLRGQLRKWAGLGQPDGRTRDIFYIECSAPGITLAMLHEALAESAGEVGEGAA